MDHTTQMRPSSSRNQPAFGLYSLNSTGSYNMSQHSDAMLRCNDARLGHRAVHIAYPVWRCISTLRASGAPIPVWARTIGRHLPPHDAPGLRIDRRSGGGLFPGVEGIVRQEAKPELRVCDTRVHCPLQPPPHCAWLMLHLGHFYELPLLHAEQIPAPFGHGPKWAWAQTPPQIPWPPGPLCIGSPGGSAGSCSGISLIRLVSHPVGNFCGPLCMASPGNPWSSGSPDISAPIPLVFPGLDGLNRLVSPSLISAANDIAAAERTRWVAVVQEDRAEA
jgi:hypothetical protein